jgi:hypothetical protein
MSLKMKKMSLKMKKMSLENEKNVTYFFTLFEKSKQKTLLASRKKQGLRRPLAVSF